MLSCQSECPLHKEGCHKNCTRWQEFQRLQQQDRQKKKDYLRNYHALSTPVPRQCTARGYSVS